MRLRECDGDRGQGQDRGFAKGIGLLDKDASSGSLRPLFTAERQLPMANTKSAAKRARQIQRRTKNNKPVISLLKNQLRVIREAVESGKRELRFESDLR